MKVKSEAGERAAERERARARAKSEERPVKGERRKAEARECRAGSEKEENGTKGSYPPEMSRANEEMSQRRLMRRPERDGGSVSEGTTRSDRIIRTGRLRAGVTNDHVR
jgi:hypothetical protein